RRAVCTVRRCPVRRGDDRGRKRDRRASPRGSRLPGLMLETNANARLMEETAVKAPRVGVAFPGNPFDARTWSGTPAGLSRGLRAAGVSVVPLNAEPAPRVDFFAKNLVAMTYLRRAWRGFDRETIRFARAIARASPELGWVQGQALRRRLRAAGPLDGAIRIGTGYTMNAGVPT